MHIPDGFLSTPVWAALDAAAAPAVGYVVRVAQRGFDDAKVPLLGVMGAFVFAAQMINFPVGIGTSGHLVGGALLACTLGPAAASVVMSAILAIQALVFQDGGILALGANVINMAIVGVLAGYLPYHLWGRGRARRAAIFAGGALSVAVSAVLALAELLISGVRMPASVLGVSLALFAVSALIEGAITMAVMGALEAIQPNFVRKPASGGRYAVLAAWSRRGAAGGGWRGVRLHRAGWHRATGDSNRASPGTRARCFRLRSRTTRPRGWAPDGPRRRAPDWPAWRWSAAFAC